MDVVQWNENLETGFSEVDQQHAHLVNLTNQFGILLSRDEVGVKELKKIFSELASYTEYHFEEEEKLMSSFGVDQQYLIGHRQEHKGFLEDVASFYEEMISGRGNARQLFDFLVNWLIYHILGSDMSMARQIVAIKQGATEAEAFAAESIEVDKSTDLLLKTLNSLFSQVTFRNRQLRELNQGLEKKVAERTRALSEVNRELEKMALTDPLTGLSNRRHAMDILNRLWQESAAEEGPLAILLIDADEFKLVNDSFGHDAGDLVLCELAKQLKYSVRTDDVVCRLGGDEFLIICPKTDQSGVLKVAEQLHSETSSLVVHFDGGQWRGSISVGVAAKTDGMASPGELIKTADRGVYAAKKAGRNCVRNVA